MSEDGDSEVNEHIQRFLDGTETLFVIGEIVAIIILFAMFAIGLFDIVVRMVEKTIAGELGTAQAVIGLLDTVLLLFIIVEAKQTVIAYVERERHEEVVSIVLFTGIIAVVRRVITFHVSKKGGFVDDLAVAGAYAVLVISLAIGYHVIRKAPDI